VPDGGIDDLVVVLVDDVLFSGRTIRAALDALSDLVDPARSGSPSCGSGASGCRRAIMWAEPADLLQERVKVSLAETDGIDEVESRRSLMRHLLSAADLDRNAAMDVSTSPRMASTQQREIRSCQRCAVAPS
jgi:hypothetical protein